MISSIITPRISFAQEGENTPTPPLLEATQEEGVIELPSATASMTPTATLEPMPSITLIFPEITPTESVLMAKRPPNYSELSKENEKSYFTTLKRAWPVIMLVIIWIVLGIWFIFSQMMAN